MRQNRANHAYIYIYIYCNQNLANRASKYVYSMQVARESTESRRNLGTTEYNIANC